MPATRLVVRAHLRRGKLVRSYVKTGQRVYRAGRGGPLRQDQHVAEDRDDAFKYTDNPGFGGPKVHAYRIPDHHRVLDVTGGLHELAAAYLEALDDDDRYDAVVAAADADGMDDDDRRRLDDDDQARLVAKQWKHDGLRYAFHVMENRPKVIKALQEHHDWVRFNEDVADNPVLRYLGADDIKPESRVHKLTKGRALLNLRKAEQLGLFATPVVVHEHIRQDTTTGKAVIVAAHLRRQKKGVAKPEAVEPPPVVEPPPPVVTPAEAAPPVVVASTAPVIEAEGRHVGTQLSHEPIEHVVPVFRLRRIEAGLEEFATRAKRLGLTPPRLEIVGDPYPREVEIPDWKWDPIPGQGPVMKRVRFMFQKIRIHEPMLQLDTGWTMIGLATPLHEGEGKAGGANLTSALTTSHPIPVHFAHTGMTCGACNTNRARKSVYILFNTKSKAYKQVGGECCQDYLGRSASSAASAAEMLAEFWKDPGRDADDWAEDAGGAEPEFGLQDLHDSMSLLVAAAAVSGGWVTSAKAERDFSGRTQPTITLVRQRRDAIRREITPAHRARASKIIEWMGTLPKSETVTRTLQPATATTPAVVEKFESASGYLPKLRAVADAHGIANDDLGFLGSAISSYERHEADLAAEAARGKGYVGKPGDRFRLGPPSAADRKKGIAHHPPFRAEVVRTIPFTNDYGDGVIVVLKGEDGRTYKWNTKEASVQNLDEHGNPHSGTSAMAGHHVWVKAATIKDHGDYQGRPETRLTRVTLIGRGQYGMWSPDDPGPKHNEDVEVPLEHLAKADGLTWGLLPDLTWGAVK